MDPRFRDEGLISPIRIGRRIAWLVDMAALNGPREDAIPRVLPHVVRVQVVAEEAAAARRYREAWERQEERDRAWHQAWHAGAVSYGEEENRT